MDYLITLHNNPGVPTYYVVENKNTPREAMTYLREIVIGYDPGVEVTVTETPITTGKRYRFSSLGRTTD